VSRDPDTGGDVRFQLAIPGDLADELEEIEGMSVTSVSDPPDRVRHELALETVAVILTIAVNAKDLAPACRTIAEKIHGFFEREGDAHRHIKVIGNKDEAVLEIRRGGTETTTKDIRVIVTR
jgi:hypothetical protein